MHWVTREGGNVDRVACPWLIKRFIDQGAQFIYVPADQVLETATALGGKSYDARGADYDHEKTPDGEICTFVTIMQRHGLWRKDPALDEVAKVVNHADTSEATTAWKMAEAGGLAAIARGFALITLDDHQKLQWEFPMYDALYAYFQKKLGAKGGA
jgi:hypothetical protein